MHPPPHPNPCRPCACLACPLWNKANVHKEERMLLPLTCYPRMPPPLTCFPRMLSHEQGRCCSCPSHAPKIALACPFRNEPNVHKEEMMPNPEGWHGAQLSVTIEGNWPTYRAKIIKCDGRE